MGTPLGSSSPASKVGYSVRFDNSTSPSTRIKFLTEGMLLQELLRDPWLRQYSAVIVDEIHERGANVDLVTGFLRKLTKEKAEGRHGVPLKVVVMSATADMQGLVDFFGDDSGNPNDDAANLPQPNGDAPVSGTNGLRHKLAALDEGCPNKDEADSAASWSGISDSEGGNGQEITKVQLKGSRNGYQGRAGQPSSTKVRHIAQGQANKAVSICVIKGRQYPVELHHAPTPISDLIDGTLRMVLQIHHGEAMPGDVLVFLPGQEDIEAVEKLVLEYGKQLRAGVPKILVLPLFAALPQQAQQEAFLPAPSKNTRKIILATNIAETSVTVSGVRYVVDGGKAKIKQFRMRLGLDSLLAKPISKSSALQRKGRAGRESPGKCFRLYTEEDYKKLAERTTPEILRSDLTQIILTIKARGVDDVLSFPFLTPPPREALEKALLQLLTLDALDENGGITAIGRQMAGLPLAPALSRALLAAARAEAKCVPEVIDIISALTVENVFLNVTSEEKREEAELARKELVRREGDHMTVLTTVQKYARESADRKAWAERHFVSHRAMQAVMDVRKQLLAQTRSIISSQDSSTVEPSSIVSPERAAAILKCFLRGFSSKTARLCLDGSYKTIVGNHTIAIHPSSVLFGRKVEAIMYNEYVYTSKSYAKGVSAVQMNWLGEALGL
ncbi:MAG: putative ATP-dependent RNA helicase dhr2 [Caeruleum heppii]|nr:MAG: putative ATP-dependent RNA helicase dhr2 [Caeruleum heppii]